MKEKSLISASLLACALIGTLVSCGGGSGGGAGAASGSTSSPNYSTTRLFNLDYTDVLSRGFGPMNQVGDTLLSSSGNITFTEEATLNTTQSTGMQTDSNGHNYYQAVADHGNFAQKSNDNFQSEMVSGNYTMVIVMKKDTTMSDMLDQNDVKVMNYGDITNGTTYTKVWKVGADYKLFAAYEKNSIGSNDLFQTINFISNGTGEELAVVTVAFNDKMPTVCINNTCNTQTVGSFASGDFIDNGQNFKIFDNSFNNTNSRMGSFYELALYSKGLSNAESKNLTCSLATKYSFTIPSCN